MDWCKNKRKKKSLNIFVLCVFHADLKKNRWIGSEKFVKTGVTFTSLATAYETNTDDKAQLK